MKRFLTLMLATVVMMIAVFFSSNRSDAALDNNGSYDIDWVNEEDIVTTTYIKDTALDNEDAVKELLRSMGMSEAFIAEIDRDQLALYTKCERMKGFYIKNDDITANADVRMFLLVTYLGEGRYLLSLDVEWITVPECRDIDLIGISTTNVCDVLLSTRLGWYTYKNDDGVKRKVELTDECLFDTGMSGWNGSCARVSLKEDTCSELKVHYQLQLCTSTYSDSPGFDVMASYDHTTFSFLNFDTTPIMKDRNGKGIMELNGDNNAKLMVLPTKW